MRKIQRISLVVMLAIGMAGGIDPLPAAVLMPLGSIVSVILVAGCRQSVDSRSARK